VAWTVGESGAMICIKSTRDKILLYFNQENRRYPLSETAQAMRYLGTGHAQGKVVIEITHAGARFRNFQDVFS
jgi:hypothetical protein